MLENVNDVEEISLKDEAAKRYPEDSIRIEEKLINLGGQIILPIIWTSYIAFLVVLIAGILGLAVPAIASKLIYTGFGIASCAAVFLFQRRKPLQS